LGLATNSCKWKSRRGSEGYDFWRRNSRDRLNATFFWSSDWLLNSVRVRTFRKFNIRCYCRTDCPSIRRACRVEWIQLLLMLRLRRFSCCYCRYFGKTCSLFFCVYLLDRSQQCNEVHAQTMTTIQRMNYYYISRHVDLFVVMNMFRVSLIQRWTGRYNKRYLIKVLSKFSLHAKVLLRAFHSLITCNW
jgi:hypothetical protein